MQVFLLNRPRKIINLMDRKYHDIESLNRYIGTENGVFKVFPGTLVPDILYDPREDRWYTAAVGQSQKYMFITHPNQNTSIVTLAKAFHQTRYTHLTQSRQMYTIIATYYITCMYIKYTLNPKPVTSPLEFGHCELTWALHQTRCIYMIPGRIKKYYSSK